MSTPHEPDPALLIVALLWQPPVRLEQIVTRLEQEFGPCDARSSVFDFTQTTYYEPEMGAGLTRCYLSFERFVSPGSLPDIKLATNAIEAHAFTANARRSVNIDPGIVTGHSLILATGKDFSHRVYVRDGIYEEVSLIVRGGSLQPLEWTYRDYRTPLALAFFEECRQRFLRRRRS